MHPIHNIKTQTALAVSLVTYTKLFATKVKPGIGDRVRASNPGEGKSISVYNQSPRSTQPGHLSVGRHNEYQPKGGDALQLGSKGRYGL